MPDADTLEIAPSGNKLNIAPPPAGSIGFNEVYRNPEMGHSMVRLHYPNNPDIPITETIQGITGTEKFVDRLVDEKNIIRDQSGKVVKVNFPETNGTNSNGDH